tara:strand:+ start:2519 stop:3439 length:921 start_codon:yes stop_codon:yes gene_type:complete
MSLKIVFMGTPKFSIPTLETLIKNNFNILKVYTQPPKKSKRGQKINISPIQDFSIKNKLDFRNPDNLNTDEELKIFRELSADLAVVVAYGKLIPKNFLTLTRYGFINIHASLLPKWRGAAPIQRAIMNGDKNTGISIMKIVEKLDSGPILKTKELQLDQSKTYGEIEKKLSVIGADLLIESLKNIENNQLKFKEQIDTDATYAKKIDKNETKINWRLEANNLVRHIHGLSPNPGAWFEYEKERFKVLRVKEMLKNGKPGYVIDQNLTVACKSNSIQILELQRQGKKKQTAKEFLLGKKINSGTLLS